MTDAKKGIKNQCITTRKPKLIKQRARQNVELKVIMSPQEKLNLLNIELHKMWQDKHNQLYFR